MKVKSLILWGLIISGLYLNIDAQNFDVDSVFNERKVLLINSYHKKYKWTDDLTRGVEETLKPYPISLNVDFLDTKSHFGPNYQKAIIDFLKVKYEDDQFDLIIAADDNAFNLLYENREILFKDVPIVFCGLNFFTKDKYEHLNNITGISEEADLERNFELISLLHPSCQNIHVIVDGTPTGLKIYGQLLDLQKKFKSRIPSIHILFNYSLNQLNHSLSDINKDDVIIYALYLRDGDGHVIELEKSVKLVTERFVNPVYAYWDFTMGYGVVGGYLVNAYQQGCDAANIALKVLSGTPIDSIPVSHDTKQNYQFDYRVLQKYDIDISRIPKSSVIINQPENFFYKYKHYVLFALIVILLLICFIVFLSILLRRTTKIKKEVEFKQLRLESIISSIPGAVYQISIEDEWKISFISDYVKKICGKEADFFKDNSIDYYNNYIHEEDATYVLKSRRECVERKIPWKIQYRIAKGAEVKWVYEAGKVIVDSDNRILSLEGILYDITNEKEAEIDLRESKRKYKALSDELNLIINNIPGLVFYKDTSKRFIYVNDFMVKGLEVEKSELIGKKVEDFYPSKLANLYLKDDDEVISTKRAKLSYEEPWIQNGQNRWLLTSKVPHFDANGNVIGLIGVSVDITDQKNTEKELNQRNRELSNAKILLINHQNNLEKTVAKRTEKINELNVLLLESNDELNTINEDLIQKKEALEALVEKLKYTQNKLIQAEKMASLGVLTAGIAHEINNPVNFISSGLTGLEILLNDLIDSIEKKGQSECRILFGEEMSYIIESFPELIKSMRNGVDRTTEIIRGLRTFSRLDSEIKVLANVNEIIDATLVILKNKLKDRIQVEKVYGNINNIHCFPGKLGQVFLNIIINAIEAIEGRGSICIRTYECREKQLCVSIKDSGKGINDNVKMRIFDPFFTTKDVGKGTGLGLSIVHGIIEEHNGLIELNSSDENGTEFIIILPIK